MAKNQKQTITMGEDGGLKTPINQTALYAAMQVAVVEDANFRYTCFAQVGTPAFISTDQGRWQVMREDLAVPFAGRVMFPQNPDGIVTNGFAFNIRVNAGVDAVLAHLAGLTYTFADA